MSSRKVRVKKLSVKTALPVLREDQIDPSEYEALTTEIQIATGVEHAEEKEYHLQSILRDAGVSQTQEIPVPPPQESKIDYDNVYPSNFHQPSSYIRFSQTVEECISCLYDMSSDDAQFLKTYNAKSPAGGPLSEDDFERIMEVFEDTAAEQTPFASVDNTIVAYDMMVPSLNHLDSPSILQHAKAIYEYWKTGRLAVGNQPLQPSLKFETHQETDDTDPFVCFRRREARLTRKTRGRDSKIAESLKRLRRELEDGRQLILLTFEREMMKRELLHMDRAVFEERAKLKQMKLRLGIKGEDEDLVNQKPQKRKIAEPSSASRPPAQLRAPVKSDGRSPLEQDLVLLADQLADKENELRTEIDNKVENHRRWNQNHIDLTREPLTPVREQQAVDFKFRPAKAQYLMSPPASVTSDETEMNPDEDVSPELPLDLDSKTLMLPIRQSKSSNDQPETHIPSFRRRIGRLQRLWIDRRGLSTAPRLESSDYSDRWKYDSDSDDDDPPVYEVDPFDTRALKFRASIPLSTYMYRGGRAQIAPDTASASGSASATKALPQPPPPPPASVPATPVVATTPAVAAAPAVTATPTVAAATTVAAAPAVPSIPSVPAAAAVQPQAPS
ncbi:Enhancer of polycomb-like protein 1 [Claviceps pazoutovae]|uniref:Enhancer of polycomb-like protein n=1 Tax=Claviceps pazoutovae TaxID=1649127 RepID=A0A9P7MGD6_9HYPO|nr:Enhancer of polycomb-like protein 1 [Claviceps pazoutovae]